MMDCLSQTEIPDECLQTTLEEVINGESEHVIQLHLVLSQHTDANLRERMLQAHNTYQTTEQCIPLELSLLILLFECQQFSCSLADLRESVLHAPYFSLVLQSVLADELEFLDKGGTMGIFMFIHVPDQCAPSRTDDAANERPLIVP